MSKSAELKAAELEKSVAAIMNLFEEKHTELQKDAKRRGVKYANSKRDTAYNISADQ